MRRQKMAQLNSEKDCKAAYMMITRGLDASIRFAGVRATAQEWLDSSDPRYA